MEYMVDITFGIVTGGGEDLRINKIIDSIEKLEIPQYEVLIVGPSNIKRANTQIVAFDETEKPAWITRKKNLITHHASYENIVFLHDYFSFDTAWYQAISNLKEPFDVLMCPLILPNGKRYRDWILWWDNKNKLDYLIAPFNVAIPYNMRHLTRWMYISGAFWIAKKEFMLKFPLDESLLATQGEDVEWSLRIRQTYKYVCCEEAKVHLMKFNPVVSKKTGPVRNLLLRLLRINFLLRVITRPYNEKIFQKFLNMINSTIRLKSQLISKMR